MSTPAAAIQAAFGADTAPLAKGAAEAEGIIGNFGNRASSLLGALGIGLGAGAVMGFFKGIVDKAGVLSDLSDNLGVGVEALQAFEQAAKMAGATSEQASAVWEKTKKALDLLAAGNDGARQQFAALNLSAKDFIGLNLQQSLELIAKGYAENATRAGAYDAISDIIGSKTAPKLNAALLQLGAGGMDSMIARFKELGAVMDESAVQKLNEFGDRVDALKARLAGPAAAILQFGLRVADGWGAAAAAVVNAATGLESDFSTVRESAEKAVVQVEKLKPALVKTTEELKVQKELQQARATLEEFLAKTAMEEADYAGKVSELKRQIALHAERAFAVGVTAVQQEQSLLKFAQAQADLKKLERTEREKITAATRLGQEDEIKFAELSLKAAKGLTAEEFEQLRILKLKREEMAVEYEIKTLLAKGFDKLSADEKMRLSTLLGQRNSLKEQLTTVAKLVDTGKDRDDVEGSILEKIRKQHELQQVMIKNGRADKDLSDRELAEKIGNLKNQIAASSFGDPTGRYAFLTAPQRQALDMAQDEQQRRSTFRTQYSREGEKALLRYSAFDEQTLRNYIRPEDERRAQEQLELTRDIRAQFRRLLGGD